MMIDIGTAVSVINIMGTFHSDPCNIVACQIWKPDLLANYIDAFTISWVCINFHCFPPFMQSYTQSGKKDNTRQRHGVQVVPAQLLTKPFYPMLLP